MLFVRDPDGWSASNWLAWGAAFGSWAGIALAGIWTWEPKMALLGGVLAFVIGARMIARWIDYPIANWWPWS